MSTRAKQLLWAFVLLITVFAVYANSFGNQFLYDDEFLIQKNAFLRSFDSLWKVFLTSSTGGSGGTDSFYRPLQQVCYILMAQWGGIEPFGFHFLNTALHALNAVLVFALAQEVGFSLMVAGFGALLWALHPLHTEAVTYMSATADPLHVTFLLSALLIWYPSISWRRTALASLFFIFALLSKEPAIVFPALAFVVLLSFHREGRHWRLWLRTAPFWMIAFGYLVARKTVLNFDNTFQFYKQTNLYTENILFRFYTFLATLPDYLGLLIFPRDLHMDRAFPVFVSFFDGPVLLGFLILTLSIAVILMSWKKRHWSWAFAPLWFFAAHVPQSGVLIPVNSLFLEHWMYLPSIALLVVFVAFLFRLKRMSPAVRPIILLVILSIGIGWGFQIYARNEIWKSPISFYEDLLSYSPDTARIHNNLAMAYSDRNELEKAKAHYLEAIRISDVYAQTRHNLGNLLMGQGRLQEAIPQFERAIQIDPNFYHSYGALAQIYRALAQPELAQKYEKSFLEIRKKFFPIR